MSDLQLYLLAADPPGAEHRRWRCQYCYALGALAELARLKCKAGALHTQPAPVSQGG